MATRIEKIRACKENLAQRIRFGGALTAEGAMQLIFTNQKAIMDALYVILEDMEIRG